MLSVIAGLLVPDGGTIAVGGRVLTEVPKSGAGRMTMVPAHRRRIGLLGQDPLLFPHLTALDNVAFGLRAQGLNAAEARGRAAEWIAAVGMSSFADRRPTALSGGQQQRIAIARVLATEPDVLLFDEPMAALDVQNASLIRTLLRECLTARVSAGGDRQSAALPATIVVTHDVVDAMVLADRVAIVEHGRIIDVGEVSRVLGQPANLFAATLVGLNLLHGVVETPQLVRMPDGSGIVSANPLPPVGSEVSVAFPPSAVTVRRAMHDPAANSWPATVGLLEPGVRGIRVTFRGDTVVAEATAAELLEHDISPDDRVTASVDPAYVTVYPRRGESAVS